MKEYKFDPDKIWFVSDMHINHKNILEYSHRPFKDVEEMNETLINNWNNTVPEDGIVFDLGDFAIGGSKVWNDALSRLHGKHYLIMGNHCMKNYRESYSKYFELVIQQMYIQVDDVSIYLNHFPYLCFGGAYREQHNVWNLFGHIHSGPNAKEGKDLSRLSMLFPTQYDVGVDNNDYKPVSFWQVKQIIQKQIENYGNR